MNEKFGKPVSGDSTITKRTTLYTPGVNHKPSMHKSIPKTTSNHQFYITPKQPNGVFMRRYWCKGCPPCSRLEFLKCKNINCGAWRYHEFQLKSSVRKAKTLVPEALGSRDVGSRNMGDKIQNRKLAKSKRRLKKGAEILRKQKKQKMEVGQT